MYIYICMYMISFQHKTTDVRRPMSHSRTRIKEGTAKDAALLYIIYIYISYIYIYTSYSAHIAMVWSVGGPRRGHGR